MFQKRSPLQNALQIPKLGYPNTPHPGISHNAAILGYPKTEQIKTFVQKPLTVGITLAII